jgi:hypothetical protein
VDLALESKEVCLFEARLWPKALYSIDSVVATVPRAIMGRERGPAWLGFSLAGPMKPPKGDEANRRTSYRGLGTTSLPKLRSAIETNSTGDLNLFLRRQEPDPTRIIEFTWNYGRPP